MLISLLRSFSVVSAGEPTISQFDGTGATFDGTQQGVTSGTTVPMRAIEIFNALKVALNPSVNPEKRKHFVRGGDADEVYDLTRSGIGDSFGEPTDRDRKTIRNYRLSR